METISIVMLCVAIGVYLARYAVKTKGADIVSGSIQQVWQ